MDPFSIVVWLRKKNEMKGETFQRIRVSDISSAFVARHGVPSFSLLLLFFLDFIELDRCWNGY